MQVSQIDEHIFNTRGYQFPVLNGAFIISFLESERERTGQQMISFEFLVVMFELMRSDLHTRMKLSAKVASSAMVLLVIYYILYYIFHVWRRYWSQGKHRIYEWQVLTSEQAREVCPDMECPICFDHLNSPAYGNIVKNMGCGLSLVRLP